jgi:hypothetical protein
MVMVRAVTGPGLSPSPWSRAVLHMTMLLNMCAGILNHKHSPGYIVMLYDHWPYGMVREVFQINSPWSYVLIHVTLHQVRGWNSCNC